MGVLNNKDYEKFKRLLICSVELPDKKIKIVFVSLFQNLFGSSFKRRKSLTFTLVCIPGVIIYQ
jgi:hypothetical protein